MLRKNDMVAVIAGVDKGRTGKILHASGKVLAVFQGHHHSGSYSNIAGIHYYTLKALVEGSGPDPACWVPKIILMQLPKSIRTAASPSPDTERP